MATGLAAPWPLKSVLDNVAGNHPAPLWISCLLPVLGTDGTHYEIRPNGSSPRRDRRQGCDHCLGRALRLREGAEGERTHHAQHTDGYVAGRFSAAAGSRQPTRQQIEHVRACSHVPWRQLTPDWSIRSRSRPPSPHCCADGRERRHMADSHVQRRLHEPRVASGLR